ncbi:MAG: lipid-A-disaccharide synthase [bacterium]
MVKKILMLAGDPSADKHGEALIRALYNHKTRKVDLDIYALGGPRIERTGVNFLFNLVGMSLIGFSEAIKKYFSFRAVFKKVVQPFMEKNRPDVVILIDSYAFNIHVARLAKKLRIPVVYYISPQVWASRSGRIKKLARWVDKMLVIFPFEEKIYTKAGMDVTFLGHPFLDVVEQVGDKKKTMTKLGFDPHNPVIGILPGSRIQEIEKLLPIMLKATKSITERFHDAQFVLPISDNIDTDYVRGFVDRFILHEKDLLKIPNLKVMRDSQYKARSVMTMALVASGSATLENACLGIPMIIVYKISSISYLLAKMLVSVKWIGMANIIAGKKIVPELIQHKATPERISKIAIDWLLNPEKLKSINQELLKVKEKLGSTGASGRAAEIVLEMIKS